MLLDREGSRPDCSAGTHFRGLKPEYCGQSMTAEVGGTNPWHSRGKPVERILTLTTLAGGELPVEVDPSGHASMQSLENAVSAAPPARKRKHLRM